MSAQANVVKMACPNCGASLSVGEELDRLSCAYCGSALSVQRSEGNAALKMAEKLGEAISDSNKVTQGAIRDGTQVTQLELKRLQINQDIGTAQLQLSNIQAEIRSLERGTQTSKIKQQLKELRQEESAIRSRLLMLQASLSPQDGAGRATTSAYTSASTSNPWYRSPLWMTLLFFILMPVWSVVILWDKQQTKLAKVIAGILLVLFVFAAASSLGSAA